MSCGGLPRFFFVCFFCGAYTVMLGAYSYLCTQEPLLTGSRDCLGVLGVETKLVVYTVRQALFRLCSLPDPPFCCFQKLLHMPTPLSSSEGAMEMPPPARPPEAVAGDGLEESRGSPRRQEEDQGRLSPRAWGESDGGYKKWVGPRTRVPL